MREAEELLALIGQLPQMLDAAPADVDVDQLRRREREEVHRCLRCGGLAIVALVASTTIGARWVDLCSDCYRWLRQYYDQPHAPGDPA
ncbi:hypothetical protein [Amycolatopsis sp. NPDC021455]|uniref:hypothetical protein n=1 Tax=Amycolatopsis sp. NPDC021455 TaxID=3154901 RepID=UPI0033E224F5